MLKYGQNLESFQKMTKRNTYMEEKEQLSQNMSL